ncbi:MAG: translation elongation factor Ts [Candidatus Omnitrophica bacterium]|nr:translation elongation factor Ts [Candidatus Omnitrophota bacterium]
MAVTMDQVKRLRELTSAGMMDCKKALKEAGGDIDEAIKLLRQRGKELAQKKAARSAQAGIVSAYIHHGDKIGVLLEVNCESDFVAKNEEFKTFAKDIAMQIAAASPGYISRDEVPNDLIEQEKDIFRAQIEGKPEHVIEKIVEGKLEKYYSSTCLLEQPFIKDQDITMKELVQDMVAKFGENIVISRFVRFALGEE